MVNRLPKENSSENFLGFITNIGRKETASPKQIVPNIRLLINPIILCFLLRLGKHSDIFLDNQLWDSCLPPNPPSSVDTPRKGSSSSGVPAELLPNGVLRVGNLNEESFDVIDEREVEDPLLPLFR